MEIDAIIKLALEKEKKYSKEEIEQYIINFNNNLDDVPAVIKKIGITTSYDMGWKKLLTGMIYDSLCRQGYMIGILIGKVVEVAVRAKKVINDQLQIGCKE